MSIDLPEHGERNGETDTFNPWHVVPELTQILEYAESIWTEISLFANSIGAWFCMQSLAPEMLKSCLLVSPVLDMKVLTGNLMKWSDVSEERLQKEQIIPTAFGETLSWKYWEYIKSHPITKWEVPTQILYGEKDHLVERVVVDEFVKRHGCGLTVMENGEHWFHTELQLQFLSDWIIKCLKK